MKMSADDKKMYPAFYQYVRYAMPAVGNNGYLANQVQKHGSLSRTEFREAVKYGNSPLIVITDLSNGQCGVPAAYGCTRSGNDEIEIDLDTVLTFEKDPNGAGVGKNKTGQKVYIAGVTLLHELCHWGNFKKGKGEPTEQGAAFEVGSYGQVVP